MTTKAEQTTAEAAVADKKARAEERRARRAKMTHGQVLVDEKLSRVLKILKAAQEETGKWGAREDADRRALEHGRDLLRSTILAAVNLAEQFQTLPGTVGPEVRAKAAKSAPLAAGDKVRVREADLKRYADAADAGLDLSDLTVVSLHGKSIRCRTFSDESIFLQASHLERQ